MAAPFALTVLGCCGLQKWQQRWRQDVTEESVVVVALDSETISRLQTARLCELVTERRDGEDHSVCMSFTVHHHQLIMTAQATSNKVLNLGANKNAKVVTSNRQPNIDVGINSDEQEGGKERENPPWRLTLHCRCTIIAESNVRFAPLREIHLAANPGYQTFSRMGNVVLLFDILSCAAEG